MPEYKTHKNHEWILKSAYLAVQALLPLDLYPQHKRQLIDVCIWKITEVDGKYKTRYRSEGSLHINDLSKLNHEHVVEKKYLIDQLLENPKNFSNILDTAIGCVVTRQEHSILTSLTKQNPSLQGWERYKTAEIKVFDLQTKNELEL